jgi:hypothetical protein
MKEELSRMENQEPKKRKLSELKKQRKAQQEERKREYWIKRKELENQLGLEGYEQYECREIIRFMLETDTDLFAIQSPITDDELDELQINPYLFLA